MFYTTTDGVLFYLNDHNQWYILLTATIGNKYENIFD